MGDFVVVALRVTGIHHAERDDYFEVQPIIPRSERRM